MGAPPHSRQDPVLWSSCCGAWSGMAGAARCSAHPHGSVPDCRLSPQARLFPGPAPTATFPPTVRASAPSALRALCAPCSWAEPRLPRKDTVFRQRDLLAPLIVQLEAGEADVIGVTPTGQELKLKNDWGTLLRKNRLDFMRSKENNDKDNIGM